MFDSFTKLSLRERLLVSSALLVAGALFFYVYLWEPKMQELQQLRDVDVPRSEQTLAWVKQALEQAKSRPADPQDKIIEGPLLTVIEQTAVSAGVRSAIRRMQPNQSKAVKIWMEEVVFDRWMNWLDLLRQQNVFVERVSVASLSPGIVTVRMTLARK